MGNNQAIKVINEFQSKYEIEIAQDVVTCSLHGV